MSISTLFCWAVGVMTILLSSNAHGGIGSYFSQYNIGIDYTSSNDHLRLEYDIPQTSGIRNGCEAIIENQEKQRCHMGSDAGYASGWGVFLQQPFKRTGDFYFAADVGFGLRYLSGEKTATDIQNDPNYRQLPLKNLKFDLAAFIVKPYIQLGYTPQKWIPDFIITIGPTMQAALGIVKINGTSKSVAVATMSELMNLNPENLLFANLEVVFIRFGEGAFSLFAASDHSGNNGSDFFPVKIDTMDNFHSYFNRRIGGAVYGFGLKLVLDWP